MQTQLRTCCQYLSNCLYLNRKFWYDMVAIATIYQSEKLTFFISHDDLTAEMNLTICKMCFFEKVMYQLAYSNFTQIWYSKYHRHQYSKDLYEMFWFLTLRTTGIRKMCAKNKAHSSGCSYRTLDADFIGLVAIRTFFVKSWRWG